jgi:outer membrane protein TolC
MHGDWRAEPPGGGQVTKFPSFGDIPGKSNAASGSAMMQRRVFKRYVGPLLALGAVCGLAGCASYHKAPLQLSAHLAASPSGLDRRLPDGRTIPVTPPLPARDIAALAVLNDPELIAARAQAGVAQAELLNAGLLPDPSINAGFAALISGPADVPAISGGLTQDLSALITYSVNRQAAKAGLAQVNAGILWQEWQVATQAEQLCITLDSDARLIATLRADRTQLERVNQATAAQVGAGNLTLTAQSASMAALAATDTALNATLQTRDTDRDQLDALLGLQPGVVLEATLPQVAPVDPARARQAVATLARRRPDLIALRYGYAQADAKLRAAILTQFLPISLGGTAGRDTSRVVSAGPQLNLNLPLFNRNRGNIAIARASRAQLAAQFTASLDSAESGANALILRIGVLQTQSEAASRQAIAARRMAAEARRAFAQGALDALGAVNLETAAADREREAITLHAQLLAARLALNAVLGIGLPPIIAPARNPSA